YDDLMKNRDYLDQVLKQGADKASQRAQVTLDKVYDAVGLVRRP
ncbi:MAG: tryptophan--tRNA ligase, partial [Moraxellaceae bacterium]|nr:tryptophan--tRNA ligase [Pseudobdellovibrionaceae bacterium]